MHTFFQQHYDSNVVCQSVSNWNESPNYIILGKYKDRVDTFTYTSPYHEGLGHYYPGQLIGRFSQKDVWFRATRPNTNRYLLPRAEDPPPPRRTWQQLHPRRFWAVLGDGNWPEVRGTAPSKTGTSMSFTCSTNGPSGSYALMPRRSKKPV